MGVASSKNCHENNLEYETSTEIPSLVLDR